MTATIAGETPYQIPGFPNWLENALFYTGPSNLTGLPALSLPVGFDKGGLPLAIQLIGRPFEEATLFRVAAALEADLGLTGAANERGVGLRGDTAFNHHVASCREMIQRVGVFSS